jgi:hypothetical protein
MLAPSLRILLIALNVLCGLLPSLAFFAWVERNAALPYIGVEWGWPWISLLTWHPYALTVWNAGLILVSGWVHSLTAQKRAHSILLKVFPPQAIRTIYIAITGISLIGVMGFWQNTGIVLWSAPLPTLPLQIFSLIVFWTLMAGSLWVMSRFDPLEFLGVRQVYMPRTNVTRTSGMVNLVTTGVYKYVRHPIYTFTLAAFLAAPLMTLDRMTVFVASALYLTFAIPLEERKLVRLFGARYEMYRKHVPAVIPRLL